MRIPPPFYALTAAIIMWLLSIHTPIMQWQAMALRGVGYALIATGLAIDVIAVLHFHRAKTTINPLRPQNSTSLVTAGIYHYTRNPMYLGMVVVLTGIAVLLRSTSPFLVVPLFIWLITKVQIIPEERILTTLFGRAFTEYQQQVRRWI